MRIGGVGRLRREGAANWVAGCTGRVGLEGSQGCTGRVGPEGTPGCEGSEGPKAYPDSAGSCSFLFLAQITDLFDVLIDCLVESDGGMSLLLRCDDGAAIVVCGGGRYWRDRRALNLEQEFRLMAVVCAVAGENSVPSLSADLAHVGDLKALLACQPDVGAIPRARGHKEDQPRRHSGTKGKDAKGPCPLHPHSPPSKCLRMLCYLSTKRPEFVYRHPILSPLLSSPLLPSLLASGPIIGGPKCGKRSHDTIPPCQTASKFGVSVPRLAPIPSRSCVGHFRIKGSGSASIPRPIPETPRQRRRKGLSL